MKEIISFNQFVVEYSTDYLEDFVLYVKKPGGLKWIGVYYTRDSLVCGIKETYSRLNKPAYTITQDLSDKNKKGGKKC